MLDFVMVTTKNIRGGVEVYPKYIVGRPIYDLMTKGGDFYAVWNEKDRMWSTDRDICTSLIDEELDKFAEKYRKEHPETYVKVSYIWDTDTKEIDKFIRYVQRQLPENKFHQLDDKIIFLNEKTRKTDYASKTLPYPKDETGIENYDKLIGTLYSPEERQKIEWAIGSVFAGKSKTIQKFLVLYGAGGTGKSTVLNIIQMLFDGYYCSFDAKSLGQNGNDFSLEPFKANPLVAIQQDGDLSRIEDNTRLNSLVSHEEMVVNTKHKAMYTTKFNCFLFMGTNKPVKITDAKSGIIRRLIDVQPTGNTLKRTEYDKLYSKIPFELGGIAKHCTDVFNANVHAYDSYVPTTMISASNDFYNFVSYNYEEFLEAGETTLKIAWAMYNKYCEDAKVHTRYSMTPFGEELKNYFRDYKMRGVDKYGNRVRNLYVGFIDDKFEQVTLNDISKKEPIDWLKLDATESVFDKECANCPAQYANELKAPLHKWDNVTTILSNIDTTRLHYVKIPHNYIVIDFDLKNEKGEKDTELNMKAAKSWPPTYAEYSQGGKGIHLHYIYTGNTEELSSVYDEDIEVKVFTGNASLRRKLSKCNDLPIAFISSGLPMKTKKMINYTGIQDERHLRNTIDKFLRERKSKENPKGRSTAETIQLIYKAVESAYEDGKITYDIRNYMSPLLVVAAASHHQSIECMKMMKRMHYISNNYELNENGVAKIENDDAPITIFDIEVKPNRWLIVGKELGEEKPFIVMTNPKPLEIEAFLKRRLVGFNNKRYDNPIVYEGYMGAKPMQIFNVSTKIITTHNYIPPIESKNISYMDLYEIAAKKQSLKKWEIELRQPHKEMDSPWDKPVESEEEWSEIIEYCKNDVLATEALYYHLEPDIKAHQMLVDICNALGYEACMNDSTNNLTTKIIFGNDRKPPLVYTELEKPMPSIPTEMYAFLNEHEPMHTMLHNDWSKELPENTHLPYFPGYTFDAGVNMYRGEDVGRGGYVYAEPGMYTNVALLDIQSMHPSSGIDMYYFGPYTQRFKDIYDARVMIKNKEFDRAKTLMNGVLAPYLDNPEQADDISQALKIAINSVYGLTSASFPNPFHDDRNKNNIIALRGALFMVNLKHEVQARGFKVAHIKTDSIKIPNATLEIIQFCKDYANKYGYIFDHEATYERMCLVNNAVYIAKYATLDHSKLLYGSTYVDAGGCLKDNRKHGGEWTATGAQFQIPYVYKTLFTHEPIEFYDLCETKEVKGSASIQIDMNESLPEGEHDYRFIGRVGLFTPIKPGLGGGELYRYDKDKHYSLVGCKGYRWLESDDVKNLDYEQLVDYGYYNTLCDKAIETISQYGDYEWFVNGDPIPLIDDRPPFDPPYYIHTDEHGDIKIEEEPE